MSISLRLFLLLGYSGKGRKIKAAEESLNWHNGFMKRLLLPLIAAIALPTSVNAQGWHLLVKGEYPSVTWTVPMNSEKACKRELDRVLDSDNWKMKVYKKDIEIFVRNLRVICVKSQ